MFTVVDCLHGNVASNDFEFTAVANKQAGITQLIDDAGRSVSSVEDCFYDSFVENRSGNGFRFLAHRLCLYTLNGQISP